MKRRNKYKYIIGVDEVGRGPLAGPVAIGVVKLKVKSLKVKTKWGHGFKDSKKLSPRAREAWFLKIEKAQSEGWLEHAVAFVSASVIDKKGLSHAIQIAITRALKKVDPVPAFNLRLSTFDLRQRRVLLDGGLRAPAQYEHQKTIIKGDEKELAIALASIVAKVTRDARMVKLSKKFPAYGFEKHKGYGTHAHYAAIKKHGIIPHHRKSFLKNIKI
ncbi:MAG: Ribonuclease HII [Parcubacteria group bacterium GW2011_GWA1_47_8]|nr:MAG: Ribonuclease HII [Parcubacteria group bacterium GW2011_GWA1_47_8]KKW07110.1 MAG: Ribonuclease HII [Parcubacteria group bacterium GW2011_GWA2_49_16]